MHWGGNLSIVMEGRYQERPYEAVKAAITYSRPFRSLALPVKERKPITAVGITKDMSTSNDHAQVNKWLLL